MVYQILALGITSFILLALAVTRIQRYLADDSNDALELARLSCLSRAEQELELAAAKLNRANASRHFHHFNSLWHNYRWGYRNNPYLIPRALAQLRYGQANARVLKLESLLTDE